MKFYGFEKLSLVDFDGHTATTVFTGGCNFYCPFCHNGGLVDLDKNSSVFTEEEILSYLNKRKGLLDGVAITGGEPTLNKDLPDFIKKVKDVGGYDVKLDSNGTNPDMLAYLAEEKLVDYFAMDIKNSPAKYPVTIGKNESYDLSRIYESVNIIKSTPSHEFRTTIMAELFEEKDFYEISEWLTGAKKYVIQKYTDSENCLTHGFTPVEEETAKKYLSIVAPNVEVTALRGY